MELPDRNQGLREFAEFHFSLSADRFMKIHLSIGIALIRTSFLFASEAGSIQFKEEISICTKISMKFPLMS